MIPNDSFTLFLLLLLVILGLLGLLLPKQFHALSRFPFVFMPHKPYDESAKQRARLWGVIALVGAAIAFLLVER
ncbi:MAG: hypothetical protein KDD73_10035 [Anaerolineales bacterium]|nr:hypothetical protein [Anaerolineales bacterium]MCB9129143.1 hypothetical protein [Ardenticatenales bacterium]